MINRDFNWGRSNECGIVGVNTLGYTDHLPPAYSVFFFFLICWVPDIARIRVDIALVVRVTREI